MYSQGACVYVTIQMQLIGETMGDTLFAAELSLFTNVALTYPAG